MMTTGRTDYGSADERSAEHQEDLIATFLGWLVAAQAFLFVAYATVVSSSGGGVKYVQAEHKLFLMVPWMGLALSILPLLGVFALARRLGNLRTRLTSPRQRVALQIVYFYTPMLFLVAWGWVLITR
jgi:hypothetical protein